MRLYNLTLAPPGAITHAVVGSFSGTSRSAAAAAAAAAAATQEIIVARGCFLEVLRVDAAPSAPEDAETDAAALPPRLVSLCLMPLFGRVRSLAVFRVTGGRKDYLLVGSDSGALVILEYLPRTRSFARVHHEVFGKSGVRRIVPGEYLATDPKGRAAMTGALEKQKFVYILNRDAATKLTVSSPLEAHRSNTITFDLVGLDVAYDNPIFASLEAEYNDNDNTTSVSSSFPDQTQSSAPAPAPASVSVAGLQVRGLSSKHLVLYELDLGLNHVVRKCSASVESTSHLLLALPGGNDGPSGVLVCCANYIVWRNPGSGHPDVRVPIPRRINYLENPARPLLISCGVVHRLKRRFFVLVQSEEGDLYRLTVDYVSPSGEVTDLRIKYFDTVPVARALVVLKQGYLFVAAEFGDHHLYSIEDLGDDDTDQPEYLASDTTAAAVAACSSGTQQNYVYFRPRDLRNLCLVDQLHSSCPLMDAQVFSPSVLTTPFSQQQQKDADLARILAVCGRGAQSSLRLLKNAVAVSMLAETRLPSVATGVWAMRKCADDQYDGYIVVSFAASTSVFSVTDTVEECTTSLFRLDVPTIFARQAGPEDGRVQVHPQGVLYVSRGDQSVEWRVPGTENRITHAACNGSQLLVCISGIVLVYFEIDEAGVLTEYPEHRNIITGASLTVTEDIPLDSDESRVLCLDLAPVPPGSRRSRFAAVGTSANVVHVISLDPEACMEPLSMQALNSPPTSVCFAGLPDTLRSTSTDAITVEYRTTGTQTNPSRALKPQGSRKSAEGDSDLGLREPQAWYLVIGLINGVFIRTMIDKISGDMVDSRLRFLGPRAVRVFRARVNNENSVIALSSRVWVHHVLRSANMATVPADTLPSGLVPDYGAGFTLPGCPDGGIVAVAGSTITIFCVLPSQSTHQATLTQTVISELEYTPKKLLVSSALLHLQQQQQSQIQQQQQQPQSNLASAAGLPIVVLEADNRVYSASALKEILEAKAVEYEDEGVKLYPNEFPSSKFGHLKASTTTTTTTTTTSSSSSSDLPSEEVSGPTCVWASQLSCWNALTFAKQNVTLLQPNECVISACVSRFLAPVIVSPVPVLDPTYYLVVGTAVELNYPRTARGGFFISTYKFITNPLKKEQDGETDQQQGRLHFVHRMQVEAPVLALEGFQGRLLAGVGGVLRLYEMGRARLLRKAECFVQGTLQQAHTGAIVRIASMGNRIAVATMTDSVRFVAFRPQDGRMAVFADEATRRYVTCMALLDYDTVCVGDKFGSVAVLRVPANVSRDIDTDPTGNSAMYEKPVLNGAPHKLELISSFAVHDWITSIQITSLALGAKEVITYTTLGGSVGALVPFASKENAEFFAQLETHMRLECPSPLGRDHMAFRSAYTPVRHVIDGDLCELFLRLNPERRETVARLAERSVVDVLRKLEDIRTRSLF